MTYLTIELFGLISIFLFSSPFSNRKVLLKKSIIKRIIVLFFIWIVVDQIAIYLSIWSFPRQNSIGIFFLKVNKLSIF